MAERSSPPSREEQEFWDAQFRDPPPRPRRSTRDDVRPGMAEEWARPRRERRHARAADPVLERLAERVRDRVGDWRHDARFGVVVLIGVALVAGVIWYRIGIGGASAGESGGAPAAVSTTAPSTTIDDPTPTSGGGTTDPKGAKAGSAPITAPIPIAVHVAGAVNHPGVVELHPGARVIDAVEAVGGALPDGDLDRLNLAARVADGQRVYVAKVGQADPGALEAGGGATLGSDDPGTGAPGAKVDLNTATQAQLEELPGIGPTYAEAIIAERQRRGGFTSVNDLRSVRGIGDKRFAELAPLVTV
jgi:competence protein ComEA